MSQKSCNILVMWGRIQQLWFCWGQVSDKLYWLSSPDTLWVLLTRFDSRSWSTDLESMVLGLPDLAWSSKFLQQNFLKHLVTALWSNDQLLWYYRTVQSISSWIRLCCLFTCMAFKSWIQWLKHNMSHTNDLDTTKNNGYLPWIQLLQSCDTCTAN